MRITRYKVMLDDCRKNVLVKETSTNYSEKQLNSPNKIVDMINHIFDASRLAEEYVWVLAMDSKNHCIGVFELSHGTVNMSSVSPREIFVRLCLVGAVNFVLVHNHPSGDITPSKEDELVTDKVHAVGLMIGINMLDHIIIGDGCYYSFNENGKIVEV
jgi:DNA repair protein RadC